MMEYSLEGLHLTESFEGCKLQAYLDSVGVPTIGYGHTAGVHLGMTCTQSQAEEWLKQDIRVAAAAVNHLVTSPLSQEEFDALTDFVFNVGQGNFAKSTLLKLLNAGDHINAAHEFEKWAFAGGRQIAGLLRRRQAEEALFMKGVT
jgi:lysozyme